MMIDAAFIFLVLFFSILFEILAGSSGLILPLTAAAVFYFSIVHGWKTGLLLGFFSGLIIDLFFMRHPALYSYGIMASAGIAVFWLHKGETKSFHLHAIPGALTAAFAALSLVFSYSFSSGSPIFFLFQLLMAVAFGTVVMPLLVFFLDLASGWLGMELYKKAKENLAGRD